MEKKSLNNPLRPIVNIFYRYNLIMSIIIIGAGLVLAILTLSNILSLPYNSANSSYASNETIKINQTTITSINKLKTSDNNSNQTLPSGRINPFSE